MAGNFIADQGQFKAKNIALSVATHLSGGMEQMCEQQNLPGGKLMEYAASGQLDIAHTSNLQNGIRSVKVLFLTSSTAGPGSPNMTHAARLKKQP